MAKTNLRSITVEQMWRGASSQAPWKQLDGQVADSLNNRHDVADGAIKRFPTVLVSSLKQSLIYPKDGDSTDGGTTAYTRYNDPDVALDPAGDYYWISIRNVIVAIGRDSTGTQVISAWGDDGGSIPIVDYQGLTIVAATAFPDFRFIPDLPSQNIRTTVSQDTVLVGSVEQRLPVVRCWSFRQSYNYIKWGNENPPGIENGAGDPTTPFRNIRDDPTGDPGADPPEPPVLGDVFENLDEANDRIPDPANGKVIRARFDFELDPAGFYVAYDADNNGAGDPTVSYPLRGDTSADDRLSPYSVVLNIADEIFPRHGRWYRIPNGRGETGTGSEPQDANRGVGNSRPDFQSWPQRLLYDDDKNVLYWGRAPWRSRLSGSQAGNPQPSVDESREKLRDLSFYQNRLVVMSQQTVLGSRAGDFFNMFINNVNVLADDDRFDQTISFGNVGDLIRAAECGNRLILLCEAAQLEFGSGDEALSNLNGRQRVLTRFKVRDTRVATGAGTVTMLDQYLNVQQYSFVSPEIGCAYTGKLNIHDKERWFNRSPASMHQVDRLLYIPDQHPGDTAVHEIFYLGGEEVQSAWGRFETVGTIIYVDEWLQAHRWVTLDEVGYTLVRYVHENVASPDDTVFWPSIDRLERVEGTYDADNNLTLFQHTDRDGDLDRSRVVLVDEDALHEILIPSGIDSTTGAVAVRGNHADKIRTPYLGFTYDGRLRLTKLFAGQSALTVTLSQLFVFHERSTDYYVLTYQRDGSTPRSNWQGDRVGVTVLGQPKQGTLFSEHSITGDARLVDIELVHDDAGRVTWSGLEYYVDISGVGI